MKKQYYLLPALGLILTTLAFQRMEEVSFSKAFKQAHKFNGGGQSGLTGAPGESNCTQCHSGTVQSGASENIFTILDGLTPVTEYVPGGSYNATIQMSSNPAKKGFSATALDNTLTMAGSFAGIGIGGTQKFSAGGRDYVSHTLTSNTSGTSTWIWTWNAPATDVGDVTFYIATNKANGNDLSSGDVIYLSTHTVGSTVSLGDTEQEEAAFMAGYSGSDRTIHIDFSTIRVDQMALNLVDMGGRSVYTENLGKSIIGLNHQTVKLPATVKPGYYAVHFFVGNEAKMATILVQ